MLKRISLAAFVLALVATAGAGAHTTSFPSAVSFDSLDCTTCLPTKGTIASNFVAAGLVSSEKAECVPDRKVKLFAVPFGDAPKELLDTDRTSQNGEWSGRLPSVATSWASTISRPS